MRLAPWLGFVAALACAVVLAVMYIGNPRTVTETRTVERQMPKRPTLKQFRTTLARLEPIEANYQPIGGVPMRCAFTDSTFDPEALEGVEFVIQWCYRVSDQEAASGGLTG